MNNPAEQSDDRSQDEFGSRDRAIRSPHFMALLAYIGRAHGIPRYGWRDSRLRYHYTDSAGLIGILESHRLWATDIRFLNDPSEGHFLSDRVLEFMQMRASGDPHLEGIVRRIKDGLRSPRDDSTAYSISFCADGDLLSQWRGYGSFGEGYSIGFDLKEHPHAQLGLFLDVHYGDAKLKELSEDLLDIVSTAIVSSHSLMLDAWSEQAALVLRVLARSFKSDAFKEEAESRIVTTYQRDGNLFPRESQIRFRSSVGEVIPYIPLMLTPIGDASEEPRLPIRQIITGPGVDFSRNRESLSMLLIENGYRGVEIVQSKIPLRIKK